MIEASMISKAFESGIDSLKKSFDMPNFFKHDERLQQINNFKDADKPLYDLNSSEITNDDIRRIPSRNQELEGKSHPITDVPFDTKTIDLPNREKVEIVVPEFDSVFDAQLPEQLYEAKDNEHFKECNRQLKEEIEKNPELAREFNEEQLEQIIDGETPDGYTWHHDVEPGKIQLVDYKIHQQTGHTGGRSVWGGGNSNR